MLRRCKNQNNVNYKHYGGKGVTVCERWLSFANFLEDMGERPDGMTIERVDRTKGYEPGNCMWASHTQQMRNTSRTVWVTMEGETKPLTAWCEQYKITPARVRARVLRDGWSWMTAITTPVHPTGLSRRDMKNNK